MDYAEVNLNYQISISQKVLIKKGPQNPTSASITNTDWNMFFRLDAAWRKSASHDPMVKWIRVSLEKHQLNIGNILEYLCALASQLAWEACSGLSSFAAISHSDSIMDNENDNCLHKMYYCTMQLPANFKGRKATKSRIPLGAPQPSIASSHVASCLLRSNKHTKTQSVVSTASLMLFQIEYLSPYKAEVQCMQEMLATLKDQRINANGFKKVQGIGRDVTIVDMTLGTKLTSFADDARDLLYGHTIQACTSQEFIGEPCYNCGDPGHNYADREHPKTRDDSRIQGYLQEMRPW
ncbi:hypothetical protein EAE96_010627 [Botrytis aclada]|nr:hypothetical protein EAE96_010627 [Botrytis aclada]